MPVGSGIRLEGNGPGRELMIFIFGYQLRKKGISTKPLAW